MKGQSRRRLHKWRIVPAFYSRSRSRPQQALKKGDLAKAQPWTGKSRNTFERGGTSKPLHSRSALAIREKGALPEHPGTALAVRRYPRLRRGSDGATGVQTQPGVAVERPLFAERLPPGTYRAVLEVERRLISDVFLVSH